VNDTPVPCTGQDGLVALIMALAADKSAEENRWVSFKEIVESVYCTNPTSCEMIPEGLFPEGFNPFPDPSSMLVPNVVEEEKKGKNFFQNMFGS